MAMAEVHDIQEKRVQRTKDRSGENYERIEEIRNRLKMNKQDFSLALGYVTGGGYDASTKGNVATLMMLLAAEGVERRYAGKDAKGPVVYTLLAVHPDGKIESIPLGGSPQTATIMGKNYILVPKK